MTGAELIPPAKAVTKAVAKAAKNDPRTTEEILAIAKETAPFKAAALSVAKRQEIKQAVILKMFQPLGRLVGASREYFDSEFAVDLAAKLEDVPDEEIQTPKPSVAMPALEALAYSVDEVELKEMYLTLLARASDRRNASVVHPAHSQIIRQLDVDEVELLSVVLRGRVRPIVMLTRKLDSQRQIHLRRNLMNTCLDGTYWVAPESEAWIDNWIRLGLVETDYMTSISDKRHYDWVDARPEMQELRAGAEEGMEFSFSKGILKRTAFGERFAKAAIPKRTEKPRVTIVPSLYEVGPQ